MTSGSSLNARWAGPLCLLVTVVGWGLNWPAVKLLLREWPPLFSRGLAGIVAALILAAIARRQGERLGVPSHLLPRLAFLAFTNVFVWMGLGIVAAGIVLGEPLGWRVFVALALTLGGVALALRAPTAASGDR